MPPRHSTDLLPVLPVAHVLRDDLGGTFGAMLSADGFDEVAVGIWTRGAGC